MVTKPNPRAFGVILSMTSIASVTVPYWAKSSFKRSSVV